MRLLSVEKIRINGGSIKLAQEFNMVFDDIIFEIVNSIKATDTVYDAARLAAANMSLEPHLAQSLFEILQDNIIYNLLKNS